MPKRYLNQNVYDATTERLTYIFKEFDLVYFSVSGGKDSSVMVQLGNIVAKDLNRKFDVFYVDYEAQYQMTIKHVYELKKLSQIDCFYHLTMPFNSWNSNSIFQPHWTPWEETEKDKWVREMPEDSINIHNHEFEDYFEYGEEVESFMYKFPKWLMKRKNQSKVACLVGIRSDESLNRFRAIAFGKSLYKEKVYSTKIAKEIYNFYPIYDWKTQDIWGCVAKHDFLYNETYNMMNKNGVSIHEQRICQPYGCDQRVSLNQWAVLEPSTWNKIVNRVSGANFGNIYCKSSLLGHNGTEKPDHMLWQEYAIFLLESMGLYSEDLMNHYIRKLKIYFRYYKDTYNMDVSDIPDNMLPKDVKEAHLNKKPQAHWRKIAKTLEKNDFSCRTLSYGITLADEDDMRELKKQYGKLLGIQTHTKEMRNLKEKLDNED